jgi:hypothetical protein
MRNRNFQSRNVYVIPSVEANKEQGRHFMSGDRRETGLKVRRQVLGDAHADRAEAPLSSE